MTWVAGALAFWAGAWWLNLRLAAGGLVAPRVARFAVPALFGVTLLVLWEGLVRGLGVPSYQVSSTGPDHDREFTATAVVADTAYGAGVGRTKKEAEQKAAAAAWQALEALGPQA